VNPGVGAIRSFAFLPGSRNGGLADPRLDILDA
jgi:hypothetical protein